MLLTLLSSGQGTAVLGINVGDVIQRLLPALGCYRMVDLTHWTEEELYEYADEAVKRLARAVGMFTEREPAITVNIGVATYPLPTRHLSTIHASLGGANLRPAAVKELEALDSAWQDTTGTPDRYVPDFLGTEYVRLYKKPSAGSTLALLFYQYPADVAVGSPILAAPRVLEDYLTWEILRQARGKEGDAAMPEVAEHAAQRVKEFEQLYGAQWGTAR